MTNAPGKHYRKGIMLKGIFKMFPDDATAEAWFVAQRWAHGVTCPHCNSSNVQTGAKHKTMPYRCRERECAKRFSAKTGTIMEGSNIGFQDWMISIYLMTTSLKSVSSMKLHRELGITQKSAWFMAHRLRKALETEQWEFSGPVEVDESYFGGQERNKHSNKRLNAGRGVVGKTAVVGVKDRETNEIVAQVVQRTDKETLQGFVHASTEPGAVVYTDEARAYIGLDDTYRHGKVNHSAGEYVKAQAHNNGIESFWSTLKRAHKGTFHKLSPKHLQRYVNEFSERHNLRNFDTLDQIKTIYQQAEGKRIRYADLIQPNGLDSTARIQ